MPHLDQSLRDLHVRKPSISQNGTAALNGLDDLRRVIAGEGEARRRAVQLHGATQRLLCALGHRIRLVKNDNLVPPRR